MLEVVVVLRPVALLTVLVHITRIKDGADCMRTSVLYVTV